MISHLEHGGKRKCRFFNRFISVSYVAEKLKYQRNGVQVCDVDLNEMAKCISTITGGGHNAATDEKGYLPTLRVAR